jgi:hypothetical protein
MVPPHKTLTEQQAREILIRQSRPVPLSVEEQLANPAGLEAELKILRNLIAKYGRQAGIERMLVTPSMAHAMLHLMKAGNRRLSRSWVERWKVVLAGERWWDLPNQGMAFDWTGDFRDGQHRCTAIIETDKATYLWVAFGVDPKAFAAMDTGLRRNATQNLGMAGVPNAARVGAVVRLRYRTQHSGAMPDDQLVFTLGQEMAGEILTRAIENAVKLRADRGATISSAALAYWMIATQTRHKDFIGEFWEQFIEGYELQKDGTIFNLRRKFRALPSGRKAHQYRSQTEQCGWIIKAWNAWVDDEVLSVHAIRWPNEHKLPEVV